MAIPANGRVDQETLAAARRRFEQWMNQNDGSGKKKFCLSFAQARRLFNNTQLSFWDIAGEVKAQLRKDGADDTEFTRQGTQRVFRNFFAEVCPKRLSWKEVRAALVAKRKKAEARQFPLPEMKQIAARLEEEKLTVERVSDRSGWCKRYLRVENNLCLLRFSKRSWSYGRGSQRYHKVRIATPSLERVEFVIFSCRHPGVRNRLFVLTTRELKAALHGRKDAYLYIPLNRIPVYRKRPLIDWWEFENAWHLLKRSVPGNA